MTTSVFPELAAASADVLRGVVDRRLEQGWTPSEIGGVVAYARTVAGLMKDARSKGTALLEKGVEAERIRTECRRLMPALELYIRTLAALMDFLASRPESAERSAWLASLWQDRQDAAEILDAVGEWLQISAPPTRYFWERASAAAAKGGPFVGVEKYEDLFGEEPRPS